MHVSVCVVWCGDINLITQSRCEDPIALIFALPGEDLSYSVVRFMLKLG